MGHTYLHEYLYKYVVYTLQVYNTYSSYHTSVYLCVYMEGRICLTYLFIEDRTWLDEMPPFHGREQIVCKQVCRQ